VFIDPSQLSRDPDKLEGIEKATLRLVVQALLDFRKDAWDIFQRELDAPQVVAEDITREALERLGAPTIRVRLFGRVDYKRAQYVLNKDYAVRQALFVDSKAEKGDPQSITLQMSETSMRVRQVRGHQLVDIPGELKPIYVVRVGGRREKLLTTTILVRYAYADQPGGRRALRSVDVVALPNGMLQNRYNPNAQDTIWIAGRNAPTLGEPFRVRLSLKLLSQKRRWRVQRIQRPGTGFHWEE